MSYYPEFSVAVVDSQGRTIKFRLMRDMFFHFKRGPHEHKSFRTALNKASDSNAEEDTQPATLPFQHDGQTYLVHRIPFDDSLPVLRSALNATIRETISRHPAQLSDASRRSMASNSQLMPQNVILFGPPGTGKTHRTVDEALRILAPALLLGNPHRDELVKAFSRFSANGQIVFTTFHQSFSYESAFTAYSESLKIKTWVTELSETIFSMNTY